MAALTSAGRDEMMRRVSDRGSRIRRCRVSSRKPMRAGRLARAHRVGTRSGTAQFSIVIVREALNVPVFIWTK